MKQRTYGRSMRSATWSAQNSTVLLQFRLVTSAITKKLKEVFMARRSEMDTAAINDSFKIKIVDFVHVGK